MSLAQTAAHGRTVLTEVFRCFLVVLPYTDASTEQVDAMIVSSASATVLAKISSLSLASAERYCDISFKYVTTTSFPILKPTLFTQLASHASQHFKLQRRKFR